MMVVPLYEAVSPRDHLVGLTPRWRGDGARACIALELDEDEDDDACGSILNLFLSQRFFTKIITKNFPHALPHVTMYPRLFTKLPRDLTLL